MRAIVREAYQTNNIARIAELKKHYNDNPRIAGLLARYLAVHHADTDTPAIVEWLITVCGLSIYQYQLALELHYSNVPVARLLLRHGCNTSNSVTINGTQCSPMQMACAKRYHDIVWLLLERGVDPGPTHDAWVLHEQRQRARRAAIAMIARGRPYAPHVWRLIGFYIWRTRNDKRWRSWRTRATEWAVECVNDKLPTLTLMTVLKTLGYMWLTAFVYAMILQRMR